MTPGEQFTVTIDKPAAGGRMIARREGLVILVLGAVPGERVRVRIDRVGKDVVYATTVAVEEASPDRRDPFTDPLCGGCLYAHVVYPRQLVLKAQVVVDACARIGRFTAPIAPALVSSSDEGYRMRARLHVRGGRVGFFREGTHSMCDARATRQLLFETCDAAEAAVAAMREAAIDSIREVEISENVDASGRVIHVALNDMERRRAKGVKPPSGVTGLTCGVPARSLALGVLAGSPFVTDAVTVGRESIHLRRHVLAFFQGNRFLLNDLVRRVLTAVPDGASVVDLYAGVGLFAVAAAVGRKARVTAVEGDGIAAADLRENARQSDGALEVVHQPVEAYTARTHPRPDVLIVDPPRTGMSREAMAGALTLGAERLVYVSCDAATFARDGRRLLDAGYVIQEVQAFDLFPNTPHVETVATFERAAAAGT